MAENTKKSSYLGVVFVISYIVFLMVELIGKGVIGVQNFIMILPFTGVTVAICWIVNALVALIYRKTTSKEMPNTIKIAISCVFIVFFAYVQWYGISKQ